MTMNFKGYRHELAFCVISILCSGVLQERKNLAGNQNFTTSPFITAMIFIKPNIVNSDKAI